MAPSTVSSVSTHPVTFMSSPSDRTTPIGLPPAVTIVPSVRILNWSFPASKKSIVA
jgi:hypothetical protein